MNLPAGPAPDHSSGDAESTQVGPTPQAERARRLDKIFGDVLPERTSDERESGRGVDGSDRDRWYLENRPPHHE